MRKFTKYLLLPITIVVWYLLTYYGLFAGLWGTAKIYTFSLFFIFVFEGIIFGVLYFVAVGLPSLFKMLIVLLFKKSLGIAILHSIAGVLGIAAFIFAFIKNPPMMFQEGEEVFILVGMWKDAPLKTILITIPLLGVFFSLLYASIIFPIEVRNESFD